MPDDDISKELEAVKIKEQEDNDSYFEKALESELAFPTDDDAGTDTSDKDKVADDPEKKPEPETVESLQAKLAEAEKRNVTLEKESKGRLSDTVKSRQERSNMKTELSELKTAVTSLLNKRDDAINKELEKDPIDESKGAVAFDDDDKAFVDLKPLRDKSEAENTKTNERIDKLEADKTNKEAKDKFNSVLNDIVAEEQETFEPAMEYLKGAYKDFNDGVITMQNRLEIMDNEDGSIDQDRAVDLMQGTEELKEFTVKHPGIDPIKVARAFNTKVDFRICLRDIAEVNKLGKKVEVDPAAKLSDEIKKAKDKPGSLAGTENQAGGTVDLIQRIADLDVDKILDFSDAEAEKVEAMLAQEEIQGE